jgi:hypothetical protein
MVFCALLLFGVHAASAQVGIGTTTPNTDAMLDLTSVNKGFLLPRVALTGTTSPSPLSVHVAGMVVYNTATAGSGSTAVAPGIYINDGTGWRLFTTVTALLPPMAQNVTISGLAGGVKLSAVYTYYSPIGAAESGTTYQWYRAADNSGSTDVAIAGAMGSSYMLTTTDLGAYIRLAITPGAATGPTPGATAYSAYLGPVNFLCGTTPVSFTYNGASVTYGSLVSPTTGICYLDRNLGASAVAAASNDYQGYGDLFQWGRLADGHQLMTWTSSTSGTAVNGTTSTLSTTDVPGNNLFITSTSPVTSPNDWRSTANDNLWQGASGINNPCPSGWSVPTQADWAAETGVTNTPTAYTQLKLTAAGSRYYGSGNLSFAGSFGRYWSSTVAPPYSYWLNLTSTSRTLSATVSGGARTNGYSVRCRK